MLHDALDAAPAAAAREAARAELDVPPDAFVVALIGRLSDWKGQDVLLRALAEPALARRGAVALLAGDPAPGQEAHGDALVRLAGELGVAPRVRMLGFRSDVGTVLGAADAVAIPSVHADALPERRPRGGRVRGCRSSRRTAAGSRRSSATASPGAWSRPVTTVRSPRRSSASRRRRRTRARWARRPPADVAARFGPAALLAGVQERYERVLAPRRIGSVVGE